MAKTYTLITPASILETSVNKTKNKRLFLESYMYSTFIPGQELVNERASQGFKHHWFHPWGAMNIDIFATYLYSVTCRVHFSEEDRKKRWKIQC